MSRRLNAAEKIAAILQQSRDTRSALLHRLNDEQRTYLGYRYGAPSTKRQQDVLLSLYYNFLRIDPELEDFDDHQMREHGFPIDHQHDEHITYKTAARARDTMIFWTNYVSAQRDYMPPPRANHLYLKLTEALRGAADNRKLSAATSSKSYIGIPELTLLIDHDLKSTPCIELAECHQLAWCIGRFTAARPGSLGGQPKRSLVDPDNDESFLTWRDVEISRSGKRGQFISRILFRNLKTNRVDSEAIDTNKTLKFTLLSPQRASNLQFSVPHRLMAMAIRRKALVGIDTVDEALDGTAMNILIKAEFLDKPVLISGVSRGNAVDPDRPLSSNALTQYLKLRGRQVGFPEDITFYSIRRRFATDLARVFGNDAAREIMGHDPKSSILERYYLDFACLKNLVAVGLQENVDNQHDLLTVESHSQYMNRLSPEQIAHTHGDALSVLLDEAFANDLEFWRLEDARDIRLYRQRACNRVFKTLWQETNKLAREKMALETARQRKEALFAQASDFSKHILTIVRNSGGGRDFPTNTTALASSDEQLLTEHGFSEPTRSIGLEPDADDILMTAPEGRATRLTPQIDEDGATEQDEPTMKKHMPLWRRLSCRPCSRALSVRTPRGKE
ncbi:hypothetical protein ABEF95_002031 [Exophiala dermatitidis]